MVSMFETYVLRPIGLVSLSSNFNEKNVIFSFTRKINIILFFWEKQVGSLIRLSIVLSYN